MTTASETSEADGWARFSRTPSHGAHPARIAALFDGALSPEDAGRLGRHPRFAERLSALMAQAHGLSEVDAPADPVDRAIATAHGEALAAIARRAGAICWGDVIAREIRAAEVEALKTALGDDAYLCALANRDEALSPVALGIDGPNAPLIERGMLVAFAAESGLRCLAAWLDVQPRGVADRVRLRLAPDIAWPEPNEIYAEAGPVILRRAAA